MSALDIQFGRCRVPVLFYFSVPSLTDWCFVHKCNADVSCHSFSEPPRWMHTDSVGHGDGSVTFYSLFLFIMWQFHFHLCGKCVQHAGWLGSGAMGTCVSENVYNDWINILIRLMGGKRRHRRTNSLHKQNRQFPNRRRILFGDYGWQPYTIISFICVCTRAFAMPIQASN